MPRIEIDDPRVRTLVVDFQQQRITRRQLLNRAATILGSLAAANSLLVACTMGEATPPPVSGATALPATPAPIATPAGSAQASPDNLVDYPGPGEGYLALPYGGGVYPAVLVIQEWWGLDDHIRDVTKRFAEEGLIALAPDLYHGRVAREPDEARKLLMNFEQDVALEEIQNAITYLISRPDVKPGKVAIIGFCMGGGLALQMAAKGTDVAIVAPFYGQPLSAELAASVKVPVVGSYGEQDQGLPVSAVRTLEEQLRAAGTPVEIKFYPAGHAFFNDRRESYNAEAAKDAWQRTLAAFRAALKA